jgi:heterotetrameric sarcosine oxidase delta subunit
MSLHLPCPNCGERPLDEFRYREISTVPETITDPDARDLDNAFMSTNPEGPTAERWFHEYGCRRWFTIRRDTSTDQLL